MHHKKTVGGFTVVELIVIIVIIAILAMITIIAFTGTQKRARDSARKADISTIAKALEVYYNANSEYPASGGSTVINSSWSTTADASWSTLETALAPYISSVPSDPVSTPGTILTSSSSVGYDYAYYTNRTTWCGAGNLKMYILLYRLEGEAQTNTLQGPCPTSPLGPYAGASNYRLSR